MNDRQEIGRHKCRQKTTGLTRDTDRRQMLHAWPHNLIRIAQHSHNRLLHTFQGDWSLCPTQNSQELTTPQIPRALTSVSCAVRRSRGSEALLAAAASSAAGAAAAIKFSIAKSQLFNPNHPTPASHASLSPSSASSSFFSLAPPPIRLGVRLATR